MSYGPYVFLSIDVYCYRQDENIEIPLNHLLLTVCYEILVYLYGYKIKLLLTEILVHTGNICSDFQGAWTSLHSVHTP